MKTLFYSFAFLFYFFSAKAQENNTFTVGHETSFQSKILGEERKIWVHIPNSNGGTKITNKAHYPVIYLLDGDDNFNAVVSITEHMSSEGLCPPMIVVGILHPDRMIDLTLGTDKEFPNLIGQGEKFMSYIEKELMPYIESTYPTTSYKTFIGHSVGGLTVMNALIHQPNLFNAYVSLDGALWWDNQKIVKEAKPALANNNYKGKTLFIAMANRMERGVDTLAVQKDTNGNTLLIRSNLELVKDVLKNKKNKLRFRHKYYEDDNHGSVRLIGEYDALRFIFEFYKLKIYDSEMKDPNFNLDALIVAHYKNVSEEMGYVVKPDESQINNFGYATMRQSQFNRAENLFKLNIANYPESANCYDSMGDLYLAKGDKLKAIENFKKALSLQYIPESKEKLEQLLKKS
jgi:predicted alpha/beta superfamily hydrolase